MIAIKQLEITRVRNIDSISMEPGKQINLIHGINGSGKTSILEAIHLLAAGRSFRSAKTTPLIQHESKDCTVFAKLESGLAAGLQKSRNQGPLLRLQGEKQPNWENVARALPVQVIDSNSIGECFTWNLPLWNTGAIAASALLTATNCLRARARTLGKFRPGIRNCVLRQSRLIGQGPNTFLDLYRFSKTLCAN
jgi:hypothetical protein